jgi:L-fuculose-phosphate aldolase
MDDLSYLFEREAMCEVAGLLWERRLTNAYGGNFCVRAGTGTLLISPTKMAEEKHCRLSPQDILLIDYDANILEGEGALSRETDMHIGLLKGFPGIGAVIHAHPMNCMVFAAAEREIPSMTEATEGAGAAGLIDFAPMCTPEMADNVIAYYAARRGKLAEGALAGILPRHGVVVAGGDLNAAYAMLELLECDAYCAIHGAAVKMLPAAAW